MKLTPDLLIAQSNPPSALDAGGQTPAIPVAERMPQAARARAHPFDDLLPLPGGEPGPASGAAPHAQKPAEPFPIEASDERGNALPAAPDALGDVLKRDARGRPLHGLETIPQATIGFALEPHGQRAQRNGALQSDCSRHRSSLVEGAYQIESGC